MTSHAWSRAEFLATLPSLGLSETKRRVLEVLGRSAGEDGLVDYPVSELAEAVGLSRRQCSRVLTDLEHGFYLERAYRGDGVGATFRLTMFDTAFARLPDGSPIRDDVVDPQLPGHGLAESATWDVPETASRSRKSGRSPSKRKRVRDTHTYKRADRGRPGSEPPQPAGVPAPERLTDEERAVLVVRGRARNLDQRAMLHAEDVVLTWGRAGGHERPNWLESVWAGVLRGWALEGLNGNGGSPGGGGGARVSPRRGRVSGRRIMQHGDDDDGGDDGRRGDAGDGSGRRGLADDGEW